MADADLKPRPAYAERCVTIQQSQRYRQWTPPTARPRKAPPLYPWMKLSGRWLEQAGFDPGQRVRIEVQHGRLVITHA